jgi:hypothetical protein
MIAKVNFQIGGSKYQFEIDEKDEMDTLHKSIVLSSPRKKCTNCGDVGLDAKYLTSNKNKEGHTFVNVKCGKCGATSKLGQYKAGGYFWHEYDLYKPEESKETKKSDAADDEPPPPDDEDKPF